MTSGWYNSGRRDVFDNTILLATDTLKVALLSNSYIPTPEHAFMSQISSTELSGTGYVGGFNGSGRLTLTEKSFALVNGRGQFTAGKMTWPAINAGSARYMVILKELTSDSDSRLIAWLDTGFVVTNGSDLVLVPGGSTGLMQLT